MNDELELDGNWSVGSLSRKRKRLKTAQVEGGQLDESTPEPKKRKRKGGKVLEAVLASASPPSGKVSLKKWAMTRISTAWMAEAKSKKLSPLEVKELRPHSWWFLPCPPQLAVQQLPDWAAKANCPQVQKLSSEQSFDLGSISALLLCTSTDRVFAVKADWDAAYPACPALPLAAHGGGRKKDQVLRQAKVLQKGASLAIATPARVLRLKEEGHLDLSKIGVVLVDLAKDMKQRDVLTLQDTRSDFFKFLREIQALLPKAKVKVPKGLALLLCGLSG
eukprot:s241_g8.t1